MVTLPEDYNERVYAGVLGKVIGVYLGRPFEGWSYEMIQDRLGDIEYYVHDKLGVPLIVTDDDISGTFTFVRALQDNHFDADISAEKIGQSWLNYLIENKTILWWGGLGNSTEHTAFLRLKQGVNAPLSGSKELNGQVVSEQIGAQIFIDGWAMVSPGDADQAARLATEAARVSHDGEAVYGAVVLAVMEAMAFVESDTDTLLDKALGYIPADSVIKELIDDVRNWHAQENDWRVTREKLEFKYGYDKYGGNCHMVPNHGLIIHSLLHGENDFSETMKIINTCGWDTDCNSGNVGCLMGIKNGLAGIDSSIEKGIDWRAPVADRIYIPTAEPSRSISDCATEAVHIVNTARLMRNQEAWDLKNGAQFHFELPGSVQGFLLSRGTGIVENVERNSQLGVRTLRIQGQEGTAVGSPVFAPSKDIAKTFEQRGYALLSSPKIYPGQVIEANLNTDREGGMDCRLYINYYGEADQVTSIYGESRHISSGQNISIDLAVPKEAHPVFEVGIELLSEGAVYLDYLRWDGIPEVSFIRPEGKGTMWRRAWVHALDTFSSRPEPYRLVQNEGTGLLIQGSREWTDYQVKADVTPHLVKSVGIVGRFQGMRRYYSLVITEQGELQINKMLNKLECLKAIPFDWSLGESFALSLTFERDKLVGSVDGVSKIEVHDAELDCGGIGLLIEEGRTSSQEVRVLPVS
ncbi:ADP-ribosylglycohydrolase family protein [Gammaproteobacteria bacterium]|nr:ADP-ribosylglycohydrolase family protein [Gammaproteobacteria bacterium]